MNDYYKQSVAVFGIGLPMLLMAIIAGVALYMTSSVSSEYTVKKKKYDQSQLAMRQNMELQGKVKNNEKLLAEWDRLMRTETRGTFLEHWKQAEKKFTGKELTKSSHNWVNYSEGLGKGVSQPASQVNMSFSATYRAMQTALMEMESTLPNMQLDSLTMTPDSGGKVIDFKTTFTVWTLK
ncbi:MAG: hypothetical protein H7A51_19040 [Akkermansiaceae bacterium]|nr:hypothetical protein [Akkermansiaceae bacterium]